MEPRLQKRYRKLVKQHLGPARGIAAGLRRSPKPDNGLSATLAAYRFYANKRVGLVKVFEPVLELTRTRASVCKQWALVIHDWSGLHYTAHKSKKDRVTLYSKYDLGYMLQAALLISDRDGAPLGPLYLGVRSNDGVHSTRREEALPARPEIDELNRTIGFIEGQKLGKRIVHIVDRQGDSLLHLRRFNRCGRTFIIRGNAVRWVEHQGTSLLLSEVEKKLAGKFRFSCKVQYKGEEARQYVAETTVTLKGPARQLRRRNGKKVHKTIEGKELALRLILAQVRDHEGTVLSTWRLWTNLPESVSADKIALWYYWRWRIESYFKLLKRAGQHIEQWQQESARAIAKRLAVASQACLIVWMTMQSKKKTAKPLRQLLIQLSGRIMKRDVEWTAPALLTGMWQLLAMIDALDQYPIAHLRDIGDLIYKMLGAD